ncbi:hypothetical protein GA0061098_10571 [Bradyrhizobium shewense]|uniref:Uncharacterized protein n=1 Tax=Bradyrhizobium shewense TaxID=1761772 RepID=A0A1C3XUF3_9BRAD|nr:hypothetical protein GA0061098_10571 [Bradyrhizobium shewense]
MDTENESNQANRTISTGKLHALLHFHIRPINVVVFHGSQGNLPRDLGDAMKALVRVRGRGVLSTLLIVHAFLRRASKYYGVYNGRVSTTETVVFVAAGGPLPGQNG